MMNMVHSNVLDNRFTTAHEYCYQQINIELFDENIDCY